MNRPSEIDAESRITLHKYMEWTRDVSVSFAFLLPLLAAYELGLQFTDIELRNSAELILKDLSGVFGGLTLWLQRGVLLVAAVVALDLLGREIPALRIYPLFLLETVALALLLGPLVGWLLIGVGLRSDGGLPGPQLLLSLGAGVYEEIVFRFLLLAGPFAFLHGALGASRKAAFLAALLFSSALFAAYHHIGPLGEDWALGPLLFRFTAGIVLGVLFAVRGLALCAYVHAFYDMLCDLR